MTTNVYQTDRDGNYEVYAVNADGTQPRRLTHTPAMENYPDWGRIRRSAGSRSGRSLVGFTTFRPRWADTGGGPLHGVRS